MFLIAAAACGDTNSKGTKSSDFTPADSDTAVCTRVTGPPRVVFAGPMTCDGEWFSLSVMLNRWTGSADMLLVGAGADPRVERHFAGAWESDRCGHWDMQYTRLHTDTSYLWGNQTTFTCTELMQDVTFVAWFAESLPPPVSDCIAWGPGAEAMIRGEWDAIVGDQGPAGGFADCRVLEPGVPGTR